MFIFRTVTTATHCFIPNKWTSILSASKSILPLFLWHILQFFHSPVACLPFLRFTLISPSAVSSKADTSTFFSILWFHRTGVLPTLDKLSFSLTFVALISLDWYRSAWERRAIALARPHTCYIKNIRVVCRTPKTLNGPENNCP